VDEKSREPESDQPERILAQEPPLGAALLDAFLAQAPLAGSEPIPSCPDQLQAWLDRLIQKLPVEGPRAGLSAAAISDSMAILKTVKAAIATPQNNRFR